MLFLTQSIKIETNFLSISLIKEEEEDDENYKSLMLQITK